MCVHISLYSTYLHIDIDMFHDIYNISVYIYIQINIGMNILYKLWR